MSTPPSPDKYTTVANFLDDKAFQAWVSGERPDDALFWQEWLQRNPHKKGIYEQAVATLLSIQGHHTTLSDEQVRERVQSFWTKLPEPEVSVTPLWGRGWVRWAAAAVVLLGLFWWQSNEPSTETLPYIARTGRPETGTEPWKTIRNATARPLLLNLPDGSSVLLSTRSELRYTTRPAKESREVFLVGEGFFEVAKNQTRPFYVYTKQLTTKVMGTSFQVRAFANEPTALVKVKTGRVLVTSQAADKKSVTLTVNEQVSLEAKTEALVKQVMSGPAQPIALTQPLAFEFTPVADVFDQLQATYGMPIQYNRELLRNCTFTGQLNDVPFLDKIRLICLTIEATYSVVDNQVIVTGKGCR